MKKHIIFPSPQPFGKKTSLDTLFLKKKGREYFEGGCIAFCYRLCGGGGGLKSAKSRYAVCEHSLICLIHFLPGFTVLKKLSNEENGISQSIFTHE